MVRNFKAYFLAWQRAALKSFWVRIMVFSEKMVCIHNSDDDNVVIRNGNSVTNFRVQIKLS